MSKFFILPPPWKQTPTCELQPPPTCDPLPFPAHVQPVSGLQACPLCLSWPPVRGTASAVPTTVATPSTAPPAAHGGRRALRAADGFVRHDVCPSASPGLREAAGRPRHPRALGGAVSPRSSESAGRVWGSGRPRRGSETLSPGRRQASGSLIGGRKSRRSLALAS